MNKASPHLLNKNPMKKFITVLSVLLLVGLFSVPTFAATATPPSITDPFSGVNSEPADDDTPPSLGVETSSGSSSSNSGSYVRPSTTTTTTPPTLTTASQTTPVTTTETKEITKTGPEMIYLILLGLLLIGGYQFAMKRK